MCGHRLDERLLDPLPQKAPAVLSKRPPSKETQHPISQRAPAAARYKKAPAAGGPPSAAAPASPPRPPARDWPNSRVSAAPNMRSATGRGRGRTRAARAPRREQAPRHAEASPAVLGRCSRGAMAAQAARQCGNTAVGQGQGWGWGKGWRNAVASHLIIIKSSVIIIKEAEECEGLSPGWRPPLQ